MFKYFTAKRFQPCILVSAINPQGTANKGAALLYDMLEAFPALQGKDSTFATQTGGGLGNIPDHDNVVADCQEGSSELWADKCIDKNRARSSDGQSAGGFNSITTDSDLS